MKQKSLFLTIAVLLGLRITATAQTPPAYVPTDGLVGWWPFNGNANDESGNGNDGVVNGATLTEDRFGNAASAYEFDGVNTYIECQNSNLPSGNSSRTISAWYYLTPTAGYDDGYGIVSYGTKQFPNGRLSDVFIKQTEIEFNTQMLWYYNAPVENLSNNWHHIAITYDNVHIDSVKIYMDGTPLNVSVFNTVALTELNTLSTPMLIGKVINAYASNF